MLLKYACDSFCLQIFLGTIWTSEIAYLDNTTSKLRTIVYLFCFIIFRLIFLRLIIFSYFPSSFSFLPAFSPFSFFLPFICLSLFLFYFPFNFSFIYFLLFSLFYAYLFFIHFLFLSLCLVQYIYFYLLSVPFFLPFLPFFHQTP